MKGPRIIIALDYPDADAALQMVRRLNPQHCRLKVGKELFTAAGPDLVRRLVAQGFAVFLDLKFHDIPNTVARACRAAADLGVWMLNVHTLGGRAMMSAAREAIDDASDKPLLIGVTLLTSLGQADIKEIGLAGSVEHVVHQLAGLARQSGLDGVVCSAKELESLRGAHGAEFCLVTPGIRPKGSGADDQQRVVTPVEAVHLGADYLVIGRPITQADDPLDALKAIETQLAL